MATYTELRDLFSDDTLRNRVEVAVIVAADGLLAGTPTTDQQKWATAVFDSPRREGNKAYMAVLAANSGATVAQIQSATDAAIQANVDSVVPALVVAYAAGG